ncbi:MAG: hypothetical protein HOP11_14430 [Saprospiraceae bacterium]|nr:hypothetical protein [Saprospiraceae bacterium]
MYINNIFLTSIARIKINYLIKDKLLIIKKYGFVLCIALISNNFSFGQKSTYEISNITIGFTKNGNCKSCELISYFNDNTEYSICITGLDLNKYQLIIDDIDTIISKNENKLNFPSFAGFDIKTTLAVMDQFGLLTGNEGVPSIASISEPLEKTNSGVFNLNALLNSSEYKKNLSSNNRKIIQKFLEKVDQQIFCEGENNKFLSTLQTQYYKSIYSVNDLLTAYYDSILIWHFNINNSKVSINEKFETNRSIKDITLKFINGITNSKNEIIKLNKSLDSIKCSNCIENLCIRRKDSILRVNISTSIKSIDGYISSIKLDTVGAQMYLEAQINAGTKQSYYSLPYLYRRGEKVHEIKLVPRAGINGPKYSTKLYISPKYRKYFGYSSGLFHSMNYDKNYSGFYNSVNDTTYITKESSSFHSGIMALVHAGKGFKNSENLSCHIGIGPTLTLNKSYSPGLVLVAGIALGSKDKLMLNVGLHTTFVRRKSNLYKDDLIKGKIEQIEVTKSSTSPLVGISYFFY